MTVLTLLQTLHSPYFSKSVHISSTDAYINAMKRSAELLLQRLITREPLPMTYDARQVANWFVTRAQRESQPLSIMSLLKLTYIAQGWHLEMQDSPLFKNRIEAWQYGPVIPDVYNTFRRQGIDVREPANTVPNCAFDPDDEALLDQVWSIYGQLPAFRLSDLTHVPGGPWDIATQTGGYYAPIPDDLIKQHYVMLRAKAEQAA